MAKNVAVAVVEEEKYVNRDNGASLNQDYRSLVQMLRQEILRLHEQFPADGSRQRDPAFQRVAENPFVAASFYCGWRIAFKKLDTLVIVEGSPYYQGDIPQAIWFEQIEEARRFLAAEAAKNLVEVLKA